MPLPEGIKRNVIDGHSHIGEIEPGPSTGSTTRSSRSSTTSPHEGLPEVHGPVRRSSAAWCMSNYGVPKPEQPFSLNPIVMEAATASDRIRGLLWVSFLPRDRENTLEALKHCGEAGIVGLKTTFLLGGNPDPEEWDEETKEIADLCFDAAEKHDLRLPLPHVGRRQQRHQQLHPDGRGVRQALQDPPRALRRRRQRPHQAGPAVPGLGEGGYKVYTDTSWAIGFGARWLLVEIEKRASAATACSSARTSPGRTSGRVLEDRGRPGLRGAQADGLRRELREAPREALVSTAGSRPDPR